MKTKTLIALLTVTLGLAVVGTYAALTHTGTDTGGPTPKPAANAAAPAETESSAGFNVKALAAKLEFLGDKPALTGQPLLIEFWAT
jgi:hypothetical protein